MNKQNTGVDRSLFQREKIRNAGCAGFLSLVIAVVMLMITPTVTFTPVTVRAGEVPALHSQPLSTQASLMKPTAKALRTTPHPTIPNLVVGHSPGTNPADFGVLHYAEYLGVFQPPLLAHTGPSAQGVPAIGTVNNPLGYKNGTAGWNGINNNAPNNCLCTPPDTSGSAGAGYVFETANAAGQIWSTSGTNLSAFNLQVFFKTSEVLSDPNIHYDPMSGRWFAEIISVTNFGNVFLSVSTGSNPAGTWNVYMVHMPNHTGTSGDLPDQINVGVGANTISLSGNDFPGGGVFGGTVIFVVNKSQAVAGTAPAYVIVGPWTSYASVHAAETLSSSGAIYFLSSCAIGTLGSCTSPVKTLNYVTLKGAPPSAYKFTFVNFTTTSTAPGSPITPGGTAVATNDNRMGSAVWENGVLWGAANDGVCAGGSASCAHLWEVNTTTVKVMQDFIWTPAGGLGAFYPAVTLDSKMNLGMMYSTAGSTAYPGVAITGQAVGDAVGTMETPTIVKHGVADGSSGTRFGDYSGAATDLSNNMMWIFGEWTGTLGCTGAGCYEWDTWVQSFNFTNSGTGGPSVTSFTANPATIPLGATSYLNVTATGGTTPYTYSYSGLPAGCASANTASLKCVPTATGSFNVSVTVTDAKGKTAGGVTSLIVTSTTGPSITSFTASPNPVTASTATTFSVTVSGGTTPYTYAYIGLPAGCASSNTNSLSCTPTATGTFNVTVTVTDANSKTATKTTALTVVAALTVSSFSASPNPVTVNTATSLSVTVSGGTTPYTYSYVGLPTGCTSSNTATLSCTPTATGNSTVTVTVTDANNKTATKSLTLVVIPVGAPTITAFTASPNPVPVNTATSLSVTVSGGTTPYTYSYAGLPTGCASSNTATLSCIPTVANNYTVTVTVTDAGSNVATKSLTLTVSATVAGPSITSFTASPASIFVGGSSYFNVTASGGTKPYVYSYSGLPAGCTSSNVASLKCTPSAAGTSTVSVLVKDANLKTATSSTIFTAAQRSAGNLVVTFTASSNPVTVNTSTTLSVSASGGTAPYSYAYGGLPTGCATSNTNSLSCTPAVIGTFNVTVTVSDSASHAMSTSLMLTVVSNNAGTGELFGISGTDWILILLVVAVVGLMVGAILIRRGRTRAPPGGPPQWSPAGPTGPGGQYPTYWQAPGYPPQGPGYPPQGVPPPPAPPNY